eukprot:3755391-Prymnesium_polylepis.1
MRLQFLDDRVSRRYSHYTIHHKTHSRKGSPDPPLYCPPPSKRTTRASLPRASPPPRATPPLPRTPRRTRRSPRWPHPPRWPDPIPPQSARAHRGSCQARWPRRSRRCAHPQSTGGA